MKVMASVRALQTSKTQQHEEMLFKNLPIQEGALSEDECQSRKLPHEGSTIHYLAYP